MIIKNPEVFNSYFGEKGTDYNMREYEIYRITDRPEIKDEAAAWFSGKWNIPKETYLTSMDEALENTSAVPQWYIAEKDGHIIAGLGVIDNDFHDRKDLSPNVCAVYVDEEYRHRGIAGELLRFVCRDMSEKGIDTLYLLTDHTSFYERYGWYFYCMAKNEGNGTMSRIYMHRA